MAIQSETSTNRFYPMREQVHSSWHAVGINDVPGLDANAGSSLGVAQLQENRLDGRREISAARYSLQGVTVLTNTSVAKVVFNNKTPKGLSAVGIQLTNGTKIHSEEVILSAGAIRSPQILMLSGIGPRDELKKFDIPVLLDQPAVGVNLADHGLFSHQWRLKNVSAGWCPGSGNPLFQEPHYGWGTATDFIVTSDVPKAGLAAAIAADEGVTPPTDHPLLQSRAFSEHLFMYAGASNGSLVTFGLISLLTTSRGSVKLASGSIQDPPAIDPNFLGTAVDRYVAREGLKLQIQFVGSNETILGRDIIAGEVGAAGFSQVLLTVGSSDAEIDARLRAGLGTTFHPMGTLAMGSVVDTDLNVRGVQNLRVVDTSVFPIVPTGHLQVLTYAMAEQAAVIIWESRSKSNGAEPCSALKNRHI